MASRYNVDDYLNSLERPEITIRGITYKGNLLSYQQFLPFNQRILDMQKENGADMVPNTDMFLSFSYDFITAMFPHPSWLRWRKPVAEQIMGLPNLPEVMKHFLELQMATLKPMPSPTS